MNCAGLAGDVDAMAYCVLGLEYGLRDRLLVLEKGPKSEG